MESEHPENIARWLKLPVRLHIARMHARKHVVTPVHVCTRQRRKHLRRDRACPRRVHTNALHAVSRIFVLSRLAAVFFPARVDYKSSNGFRVML